MKYLLISSLFHIEFVICMYWCLLHMWSGASITVQGATAKENSGWATWASTIHRRQQLVTKIMGGKCWKITWYECGENMDTLGIELQASGMHHMVCSPATPHACTFHFHVSRATNGQDLPPFNRKNSSDLRGLLLGTKLNECTHDWFWCYLFVFGLNTALLTTKIFHDYTNLCPCSGAALGTVWVQWVEGGDTP